MHTPYDGLLVMATLAPLLTVGACACWRPLYALLRGHATLGRVTEIKRQPGEAGDPAPVYWHPIVEYRDECGATRRFVSRYGTTSRPIPIGTVVTVRFVPGHPRYADITSLHGAGAASVSWLALRVPMVAGVGIVLFNVLTWSL